MCCWWPLRRKIAKKDLHCIRCCGRAGVVDDVVGGAGGAGVVDDVVVVVVAFCL